MSDAGGRILGARVGPSLDAEPSPYLFPGIFYPSKPVNASCRELGLDVRTTLQEAALAAALEVDRRGGPEPLGVAPEHRLPEAEQGIVADRDFDFSHHPIGGQPPLDLFLRRHVCVLLLLIC